MKGGSQVSRDSQESRGSPDLKDQSEPEERREVMDLKDQVVQKESEGPQDCQDFQEHQDFQVCRGRMVLQARGECRAATGQRVKGVSQEAEESPDSRDYRVHLVCQDQRVTQVT